MRKTQQETKLIPRPQLSATQIAMERIAPEMNPRTRSRPTPSTAYSIRLPRNPCFPSAKPPTDERNQPRDPDSQETVVYPDCRVWERDTNCSTMKGSSWGRTTRTGTAAVGEHWFHVREPGYLQRTDPAPTPTCDMIVRHPTGKIFPDSACACG